MIPFLGVAARSSVVTNPEQPPVSGSKPTEAPVLQAKGLSLVWQDRILETGGPTSDWDFFQETTGSRRADDPPTGFPSENPRRLSLATHDSKKCMKVVYPVNQHGWLNYRSQHLPTHYRELGLCVDVLYPSGFNLTSITNANIVGKSLFGLMVGPPETHKPGFPVKPTDVTWPEDQWGGALGISWKYWTNTPEQVQYEWYPHVVGAYLNGQDKFREDNYSNIYSIPGYAHPGVASITTGVWHRLELYGIMDTNRRNGALEMWVDGVKNKSLYNLDLGGWQGDRGLYKERIGNGTRGDGSKSQGTGQLCGASGGGWKFVGVFIREMIGGNTAAASLTPKFGGAYYAHNWRVYGKV